MIGHCQQNMVRLVSMLMLSLFALSTVWCEDSDRMLPNCEGHCSSLACNWLSANNVPNALDSRGDTGACLCICHTPVTPALIDDNDQYFTAEFTTVDLRVQVLLTLSRSVYHPPKS
jgi:hypothetical protein